MFGRLALSLDKKKNASKQQIHGEKKFREVSIVLLSHGIGAQFQHLDGAGMRVILGDEELGYVSEVLEGHKANMP